MPGVELLGNVGLLVHGESFKSTNNNKNESEQELAEAKRKRERTMKIQGQIGLFRLFPLSLNLSLELIFWFSSLIINMRRRKWKTEEAISLANSQDVFLDFFYLTAFSPILCFCRVCYFVFWPTRFPIFCLRYIHLDNLIMT